MLTLERMRAIRLHRRPVGQIVFANAMLAIDYRFPRPTHIEIEGLEHLPRDRTVILAMNHTDRYNYWPFQYQLYRKGLPFTATWVKGKYYESAAMAAFMDACNNIPLPSRGFVLSADFRACMGRKPSKDEYRCLRDWIDGKRAPDADLSATPGEVAAFVARYCAREDGDPTRAADAATFLVAFDRTWLLYVHAIVRLTNLAMGEAGNNLLVFPEGTRGKTLGTGQVGTVAMAWHLGRDIVPVGCNGSDACYPGNSPFSRGGRIVYRVGPPLRLQGPELAPFTVPRDVTPLTRDADPFAERYRAATAVVMSRIAALLDPKYLPASGASPGQDGVERFM